MEISLNVCDTLEIKGHTTPLQSKIFQKIGFNATEASHSFVTVKVYDDEGNKDFIWRFDMRPYREIVTQIDERYIMPCWSEKDLAKGNIYQLPDGGIRVIINQYVNWEELYKNIKKIF